MPALPFHLLAQIFLQLQGQPALPTAQAFGNLLQVMGPYGRLGQLAEQCNQATHCLLKLIRLT